MAASQEATAGRKNSSGLTRDVEILELLGDAEAFRSGGLSVTRIAELTGRDKAVISRALATLAASDIIERDENTLSYRLGSRLYALAGRTSQATLAAQARTSLRHIAQSTRETTHLCVLRGGNVLTLISELSSLRRNCGLQPEWWHGETKQAVFSAGLSLNVIHILQYE